MDFVAFRAVFTVINTLVPTCILWLPDGLSLLG